jgi:GxxExxY protein
MEVNEPETHRNDLVYPELSYQLVGLAFNVFNALGFGHLEKVYQRAYAKELRDAGLKFSSEIPYKVEYKGEVVGIGRFDFLVEEKIIVELKKNDHFSKQNIDQVNNYLKISNLQLALLINFSKNGVLSKRLVNIKSIAP